MASYSYRAPYRLIYASYSRLCSLIGNRLHVSGRIVPWQTLLLRIVIVASLSKGIRAHFVSAWSSAITVANNIWHSTAVISPTVLETVLQPSHYLLIKTTQPIPSYTEFSHCFVDQRGLLVPKRSCGSCNLNQYQIFFSMWHY